MMSLVFIVLLSNCLQDKPHWDYIHFPLTIDDNTNRILAQIVLGEIHSVNRLTIDIDSNLTWISNAQNLLSSSFSLSIQQNIKFYQLYYEFNGDIAKEYFFFENEYLHFCTFALVYLLPSPHLYQTSILALGHNAQSNYSLTEQLINEEAITKNVFMIHIENDKGTLYLGDDSLSPVAQSNKLHECSINNITSPYWNCYIKHIAVSTWKTDTQKVTFPYAVNSIVEFSTNKPLMYVPIDVLQHITHYLFSDRINKNLCYEISHRQSKEILCQKHAVNKVNTISFIIEDFKVTFNELDLFVEDSQLSKDEMKFGIVSIRILSNIVFGILFIKKINMAFDKEEQKVRMYKDSLLSFNDIDINQSSLADSNDKPYKTLFYSLICFVGFCVGVIVLLFIVRHFKKKKLKEMYHKTQEILLQNHKLSIMKE